MTALLRRRVAWRLSLSPGGTVASEKGLPANDAQTAKAFWNWFVRARSHLEARITQRAFAAADFDEGNRLLPEGIGWEIGRAADGVFELMLSGGGGLPARRLAERVVNAAPPLRGWRLFPARQRSNGYTLQQFGVTCDPNQLQFAHKADANRRVLDVQVWHPVFAQVDAKIARALTYQLLDMLLGEDAVETWLGRIETAPRPLSGFADLPALRAAIAELQETEPLWVLMRGGDAGAPSMVRACIGLKARHYLELDHSLSVRERYVANPNGWPTSEELQRLNELEDSLSTALGDRAILNGRELSQAQCTWYFHTALGTESLAAEWARMHSPSAVVRLELDEDWRSPPWIRS